MATTGQDQGAKDKPDQESGEKKSEATNKKEPAGVPVGEHIEMRQQLREASEELRQLRATVAELQGKSKSAEPQTPNELKEIRETVKALADQNRINSLISDLGLASKKQGELVAQLLADNPKLSPVEALSITALRHKDEFKEQGTADAGSVQFGQLRPAPSSQNPSNQPKVGEQASQLDYIAKLMPTNKRLAEKHWQNAVGAHAAQALGWDHVRLKVPQ